MSENRYDTIGRKVIDGGIAKFTAEFYSNGAADGFIYKNETAFYEPEKFPADEIVYIPEYGFPDGKTENAPQDELCSSYTRADLIALTNSEYLAGELFEMLSWQHPESLWDEMCEASDHSQFRIESRWAYEKVYVPEFTADADRKGQEPVCYAEFCDWEWRDGEYREYCINRLAELGVLTDVEAKEIIRQSKEMVAE